MAASLAWVLYVCGGAAVGAVLYGFTPVGALLDRLHARADWLLSRDERPGVYDWAREVQR